jgi:dUTP pyrophosphatase
MSRGFAWIREYEEGTRDLPRRKTLSSAGYDIASVKAKSIPAGKTVLLPTGLKAYMETNEVLLLFIRSSKAIKKNLILTNGVGVIDADYYNNSTNEGHILLAVTNIGAEDVRIEAGEEIAQGVFTNYLLSNEDILPEQRTGGFGSTDQRKV